MKYHALCLLLACWEVYTGSLWTLGIGESRPTGIIEHFARSKKPKVLLRRAGEFWQIVF
jgi:hypothetical protein